MQRKTVMCAVGLGLLLGGLASGCEYDPEIDGIGAELASGDDDCLQQLVGLSVCDEEAFQIEGLCMMEWAMETPNVSIDVAFDYYDHGYAMAERQCRRFEDFQAQECQLSGIGCSGSTPIAN